MFYSYLSIMSRVYNYQFQSHDVRDYVYQLKPSLTLSSFYIPNSIQSCPILDQSTLGSCVAHSAYVLFYIESKKKINLSRLHLYFCSRALDNFSLTQDTGVTIRGCMKAIKNYKLCDEKRWGYVLSNFAKLPPADAFVQTYNLTQFTYTFLPQVLETILNCLSNGHPIMLGIYLYNSFETSVVDKYGVVPIPNPQKEKLLGGHAISLVGFDVPRKYFKFQNSWGTAWGDKGYGYIPFDYILNKTLASDLVTVSFSV